MEINEFLQFIRNNKRVIFKYKSVYYSLFNKLSSKSLALESINVCSQHFSSIEKLINNAVLNDRKLLKECINEIEIVNEIELSYDFMKHWFTVHYAEIEFYYKNVSYWMTRNDKGECLFSSNNINLVFNTPNELFENSKIDGRKLVEIWPYINLINY